MVLAAVYLVAIWLVNKWIFAPRVPLLWLSVPLAFCLVQCLVIIVLMVGILARKLWFQRRAARAREVGPVIEEELAQLMVAGEGFEAVQPEAAGGNSPEDESRQGFRLDISGIRRPASVTVAEPEMENLRELYGRYPDLVETKLVAFLTTVGGSGRGRLLQIAVALGLISKWEKQLRSPSASRRHAVVERLSMLSAGDAATILRRVLEDKGEEEHIRTEAARGLLRSGDLAAVEEVFEFTVNHTPFVRAMLAVDLSAFIPELAQHAIPQTLSRPRSTQALVTLQLIEAWSRALLIDKFGALLQQDGPVKAAALRALPYVANVPDADSAVLSSLEDADPDIRRAAAIACGKMRLRSGLGPLGACLQPQAVRDGEADASEKALAGDERQAHLFLAAAQALAQMPPEGTQILQETIVSSSDRLTAAIALETLDKVRLGRMDFGGA